MVSTLPRLRVLYLRRQGIPCVRYRIPGARLLSERRSELPEQVRAAPERLGLCYSRYCVKGQLLNSPIIVQNGLMSLPLSHTLEPNICLKWCRRFLLWSEEVAATYRNWLRHVRDAHRRGVSDFQEMLPA